MGIYRGHLGEISNKADWLSPIFEFVDENNIAINLSAAEEIYFEIKSTNRKTVLVEATLADGQIVMIDDSKFQISLVPSDLTNLCEGEYAANVSYTLAGLKHDPILAMITVIEGAGP